jgi:hypothetical protein
MKDENVNVTHTRALSVCEEFCKYVVVDNFNQSILTNVAEEYYAALVKRLKPLGYVELFRASVYPESTITSTFLHTYVE